MLNDFSKEYAEQSDDELLQLASDRASLTNEAVAALDAELSRRNLTPSDQAKHQRFVKRNEQREAKRRLRKVFGPPRDRSSWVDLFWSLLAMSLISFAYLALLSRYHLKRDWQEAAVNVMFASVFIAVASSFWWRLRSTPLRKITSLLERRTKAQLHTGVSARASSPITAATAVVR